MTMLFGGDSLLNKERIQQGYAFVVQNKGHLFAQNLYRRRIGSLQDRERIICPNRNFIKIYKIALILR